MISLSHGDIKLRAMEPDDLDFLFVWENDESSWDVSNTVVPYSRHQLEDYIRNSGDIYSSRQLRLVICFSEEPVGLIDLYDFDPHHLRAGIGVLIGNKRFRQKGIASASIKIMIGYAFKHLHLHQLFCHISDTNQSSRKLFENNGFIHSGTLKEWRFNELDYEDVHVYQLLKH